MGPVRQNPIQRTVRSVHMCVHLFQKTALGDNVAEVFADWMSFVLPTLEMVGHIPT